MKPAGRTCLTSRPGTGSTAGFSTTTCFSISLGVARYFPQNALYCA